MGNNTNNLMKKKNIIENIYELGVELRAGIFGTKGVQHKLKNGQYLTLTPGDIYVEPSKRRMYIKGGRYNFPKNEPINLLYYLNPKSELLVIDCDVSNGKDGINKFKLWLVDIYTATGKTREEAWEIIDKLLAKLVITQSGGTHYYFKKPSWMRSIRGKLPVIDWNGEIGEISAIDVITSGIVVAPLSVYIDEEGHERQYIYRGDETIDSLPKEIEDYLYKCYIGKEFKDISNNTYYEFKKSEITQGNRSNELIKLAGFLSIYCDDFSEVENILRYVDNKFCTPPMQTEADNGWDLLLTSAKSYFNKSNYKRSKRQKKGIEGVTLQMLQENGFDIKKVKSKLYSKLKKKNYKKLSPQEVVDELIASGQYEEIVTKFIGNKETPRYVAVLNYIYLIEYDTSLFSNKKTRIKAMTPLKHSASVLAKYGLKTSVALEILRRENLIFENFTSKYTPIQNGVGDLAIHDNGLTLFNVATNDISFYRAFTNAKDEKFEVLFKNSLPILRHISHIASGDDLRFRWLLSYIYNLIFTKKRLPILTLYSKDRGVGKSMFLYNILFPLIGNATTKISASDLGSNFNSFLFGKRLIAIEEMEGGKKVLMSKLKDYSTADFIGIEQKFQDKMFMDFHGCFVITTNDPNFIDISAEKDRFAIFDVQKLPKIEDASSIKNKLREATPYFAQLLLKYFTPIKSKGRFALNTNVLYGEKKITGTDFENLATWKQDLVEFIYESIENENFKFYDNEFMKKSDCGEYLYINSTTLIKALSNQKEYLRNKLTSRSVTMFIREYFNADKKREYMLQDGSSTRTRVIVMDKKSIEKLKTLIEVDGNGLIYKVMDENKLKSFFNKGDNGDNPFGGDIPQPPQPENNKNENLETTKNNIKMETETKMKEMFTGIHLNNKWKEHKTNCLYNVESEDLRTEKYWAVIHYIMGDTDNASILNEDYDLNIASEAKKYNEMGTNIEVELSSADRGWVLHYTLNNIQNTDPLKTKLEKFKNWIASQTEVNKSVAKNLIKRFYTDNLPRIDSEFLFVFEDNAHLDKNGKFELYGVYQKLAYYNITKANYLIKHFEHVDINIYKMIFKAFWYSIMAKNTAQSFINNELNPLLN